MKLYVYYMVIVASLMHTTFSQDTSEFEVCDVEGSGIGDCEENVNCCEQSICDIKHNPESNPDKRCCTREEMKEIPPWLCELCIECCDEEERNQTPFPIYCSKCSRCDPGNI